MRRCLWFAMALALAGCQWGYYGQAIRGHWQLMSEREPVETVLAQETTPPFIEKQLRLSREVLAFAQRQMDLPAKGVYDSYVALDASAVVWNVLAAPPLSLTPKTWCYPLVGCVSYRGYFDREDAKQQAAKLEAEGLDTYLSGAIAYSTLGWFSDPLTTPMLDRSRSSLVELLLHELVHRRLYVRGDTRFNESLATMVAREGALRFLARADGEMDADAWHQRQRARQRFVTLIREAREQLEALYQSDRSDADKLKRKAEIQAALRARYHRERNALPALGGYQFFFDGPLNNAQLNGVSDYNDLVPAFQRLLLTCGGRWACFWERVERMSDMAPLQRRAALESQ